MEREEEKYELFRRAIVDQNSDAWAMIATHYRSVMIMWAARALAERAAGEHCQDLADQALAQARAALSPEHFAAFPSLAALLAYLRTCVITAAISSIGDQTTGAGAFQDSDRQFGTAPELLALARLDSTELWQLVTSQISTEAEHVALHERFVLNLPPRIIQSRHPELFADIKGVYTAIRKLCQRI